MNNFLENFRVARYRFLLRPRDYLKLSHYAGSSLRRDFVDVFKEISCTQNETSCKSCPQKAECAYYHVIEGGVRKDQGELAKRFQTPPKPFVFEPPLNRKTFYSMNEDIAFDLILIGKALEYFPYFVAAMRRIGEIGMGRNHGKFTIRKILGIDLKTNYTVSEYSFVSSGESFDRDISVSLEDIYKKHIWKSTKSLNEVEITFLSPLRMKRVGYNNWHLYFRTLIKNILSRVSILNYFHNNYPDLVEFTDLIENSRGIRIAEDNLIWDDWRNPRKRNDSNHKLGGYLGDISYTGNLENYWPLLKIAEILHVGKNCGFGMGRILVEAKK